MRMENISSARPSCVIKEAAVRAGGRQCPSALHPGLISLRSAYQSYTASALVSEGLTGSL